MKPLHLIPLFLFWILLPEIRTVAQAVEIPDKVLEEIIRQKLEKEEGELTRFDLSLITSLDLSGENPVKSLEGLQHATNMLYLKGYSQDLGLVEIPETWTKLNFISLFFCSVQELRLPTSLPELTSLNLSGNELSQLVIPTNAPKLNSISVSDNHLTELKLPPALQKLASLDLLNNSVEGIEFPPSVKVSLVNLFLGNNPLTNDFNPAEFPSLNTLDLSGTGLKSFTFPTSQNLLRNLYLDRNVLQEFHIPSFHQGTFSITLLNNPLTNLSIHPDIQIENLSLSLSKLTNPQTVRSLPQARTFSLEITPETDLSFLETWKKLRHLHIQASELKQLHLPPSMSQLESLGLVGTQVADLQFLKGMTNLRHLDLRDNRLAQADFPEGLKSLFLLDLSDNMITRISAAEEIPTCRMIFFFNNGVNSLTLMPEFSKLDFLGTFDSPLSQLILPDVLATNYLATLVEELREAMAEVYTYPVLPRLEYLQQGESGGYDFWIKGPPGIYTTESTTNLASATWTGVGRWTNTVGEFHFHDAPRQGDQRYYRVHRAKP